MEEQNNNYDETGAQEANYAPAIDVAAALAAYQHRKMVEGLVGPIASLIVHVCLLTCLILFYHPEQKAASRAVEVQAQELEVKELDQKTQEELQQLEEIAQDIVPTVEKPTITSDVSVDVSAVADFSDAMASTDDNLEFSDVLDIRANDSPLKISSLYGGRSNEGRKQAVKRFGGNDATELAVLRALRWLKATQAANGSWAPSQQPAMTGLALLAYLAHGETPTSEEFGPTVQKGMEYLVNTVNNAKAPNGNLSDYRNGIVAYALAEAYGLTKIPFIKLAMEKSLTWLVEGQQASGGYDYGYKKAERWDLSVACWQYQAMKAGYIAGADVKGLEKAIDKGLSFMKNVAYNPKTKRFYYCQESNGSDRLQGAAILCFQLLGEGSDKLAKQGLQGLADKMKSGALKVSWTVEGKQKPAEAAHENEMYGWYYQTQAMFHGGQTLWRPWNKMFTAEFVKNQKVIGEKREQGYWECPRRNAAVYDKAVNYDKWYTTALAALSLQVYYRYLPSYKMPKSMAKAAKTTMEKLDDDLGLDF